MDDRQKREIKRHYKEQARQRMPLEWNGTLVGSPCYPKFDWPHHYGQWEPLPGPHYDAFLETVRQFGEDEGVPVMLKGMPCHIFYPPEEKIELRISFSRT